MFGIDSPELLVIAIVALVFIGPKELPGLLRTWGKWMAQMRGMASEFRGHVDEMVRQSELDEVKKHLESATGGVDLKSLDPTKQIRDTIQEGMAEGEKALAEAKSSLETSSLETGSSPTGSLEAPPAEPEAAPQLAAAPEPAQLPPAATGASGEASTEAKPVADAKPAEPPAKAAAE